MPSEACDFELIMDDLRVVARYAVESAQGVLPLFEDAYPGDPRPRAAIEAAWAFVNGAPRTRLQRVTAMDAHRAAKEAASEASKHAALAAGDAAAAAYLHILRAAANAARAAEFSAGDDSNVGDVLIEQARERATPALIDILCRYPPAPVGNSRVAIMMKNLDTTLRARYHSAR
jgi:hypothetical protein